MSNSIELVTYKITPGVLAFINLLFDLHPEMLAKVNYCLIRYVYRFALP